MCLLKAAQHLHLAPHRVGCSTRKTDTKQQQQDTPPPAAPELQKTNSQQPPPFPSLYTLLPAPTPSLGQRSSEPQDAKHKYAGVTYGVVDPVRSPVGAASGSFDTPSAPPVGGDGYQTGVRQLHPLPHPGSRSTCPEAA